MHRAVQCVGMSDARNQAVPDLISPFQSAAHTGIHNYATANANNC